MFQRIFPLVFFVLALSLNHVFGTNQHMICKTVEEVFTDGGLNQDSTRPHTLQGPQGKRGAPGVKGETGLPGFVDPQMIENTLEEKVNAATRQLQDRIENLERQVSELNSTIVQSPVDVTTSLPDTVCDEGIVYRGKCYYPIIHDGRDVVLSEGNGLCRDSGGRLADILNLEHQVLVENYARQKKAQTGVIFLWLGMKYESSTKTVRGSNGMSSSTSSFRWHDGYPQWQSNMGISIEASTSLYGIFTTAENNLHGSLCEK